MTIAAGVQGLRVARLECPLHVKVNKNQRTEESAELFFCLALNIW